MAPRIVSQRHVRVSVPTTFSPKGLKAIRKHHRGNQLAEGKSIRESLMRPPRCLWMLGAVRTSLRTMSCPRKPMQLILKWEPRGAGLLDVRSGIDRVPGSAEAMRDDVYSLRSNLTGRDGGGVVSERRIPAGTRIQVGSTLPMFARASGGAAEAPGAPRQPSG
jgi:hypothetical protein